jgi:hypothetical protein
VANLKKRHVLIIFAIILLVETFTVQSIAQNNINAQTPLSTQNRIPVAATSVNKYTYEEERIQSTFDAARPSWNPGSGGSSSTTGNGGIYTYTGYLGVWGLVDNGLIYPSKWNIAVSGEELSLTYDNAMLSQYHVDEYCLQIEIYYSREIAPFNTYGVTTDNLRPITVTGEKVGYVALPQTYDISTAANAGTGLINFNFSLPNQNPTGTTSIKLTTESFKNAVNPVPLQAPSWTGNPHIEAYDESIWVTVAGYIVPIEDLAVETVEPVQVVFGASALVKYKPTAIRTEITSTFKENVTADLEISIGNYKFLDTLNILVGTENYYLPSGNPLKYYDLLETGQTSFTLKIIRVHPLNDANQVLEEAYTNNNEKSVDMKILESKGFKILYVFNKIKIDYTLAEQSTEFIKKTYPVVPHDISYGCRTGNINNNDLQTDIDQKLFPIKLWKYVVLSQNSFNFVVGVVDQQVLDNTGTNGGYGHPDIYNTVVIPNVGYCNAAHEIGHKRGLYPYPSEEYTPGIYGGNFGIGYDVLSGTEITNKFCFMGSQMDNSWICKPCYENLLKSLKVGSDPPLLCACGMIYENETTDLNSTWYQITGIPDITIGDTGNYSLVYSNSQGVEINRFYFNASFYDATTGIRACPFAFSLPFTPGTSIIRIEHNSRIIGERQVSIYTPVVQVISPNGGEYLSNQANQTVTWQGSDVDGDTLTYSLLYSDNNGTDWNPIAIDLNQTSYTWDTIGSSNSTQCLIKIIASDGVNTAEDTSNAVFTLDQNGNTAAGTAPVGEQNITVILWATASALGVACIVTGAVYGTERRKLQRLTNANQAKLVKPVGMQANVCRSCGASNRQSAKFCRCCGRKLR